MSDKAISGKQERSEGNEPCTGAFARARVAAYKVPRSVDFETALPRHSSGKLYVRHLRDRYWQGRARKI